MLKLKWEYYSIEKSELINAMYELEPTVLRQPKVNVLARGNEVTSIHSPPKEISLTLHIPAPLQLNGKAYFT